MNSNIINWKKLGEIGVDGGIIIISDAANFPKYFDSPHLYSHENPDAPQNARIKRNKIYPEMDNVDLGQYDQGNGFIDILAHDTCLQIGNYSGYSVPWLGGDGTFTLWGRFVENNLVDILIYADGYYNIEYEYEFEIKKNKDFTINVYSGNIGIDEPNQLDDGGFVQSEHIFACPRGNGQYNIFEINLNFKEDTLGEQLLGTLIELHPDNEVTKNNIKELMKKIREMKISP